MPGLPVPNNGLKTVSLQMQGVAASGGAGIKRFDFGFAYRRTTVVNVPSEAAFEAIFTTGVVPSILAALNARYTQTFNLVRFVEDAQRVSFQQARAGVGGRTGDSMAMHMSVYILMRMNLRGRGSHGSKHFGPISESDTTSGTDDILNAAAIALWNTAITAMANTLTDANGNIWVPTVVSKVPPAQYRYNPTNVVTYDVNQILLNKRLGRMKRREVSSVY